MEASEAPLSGEAFRPAVLRVVCTIPEGRLVTFADVAKAIGRPRAARAVGQVLASLDLDRTEVPWFRVVRAQGSVSCGEPQIVRLRRDGVVVDSRGRIDRFEELRWQIDPERLNG